MDTFPQDPLTKRKKALLLHEDPTAGFKLADWFAEHGYQAILSRTIDDIKPHLGDIRPDVIVVDCPPAHTATSDALPRLQAVCPTVPIIAVTHIGRPDPESRATNQCKTMLGAGVFVCEAADSVQ
jgi:DNA-binding response OmpR family regulator